MDRRCYVAFVFIININLTQAMHHTEDRCVTIDNQCSFAIKLFYKWYDPMYKEELNVLVADNKEIASGTKESISIYRTKDNKSELGFYDPYIKKNRNLTIEYNENKVTIKNTEQEIQIDVQTTLQKNEK